MAAIMADVHHVNLKCNIYPTKIYNIATDII